MKISDIKIGVRLGSAFGAVLLLMVAMVAVGIGELSKIADAKAEMTETAYKQRLAADWLKGIATNAVRTYAKVRSATAEDEQFFGDEMKKASAGITEIQKELETLIVSDQGKALFAAVGEKRKAYVGIRDAAFKLKADPAGSLDDLNNKVRNELMPAMAAYTKSVEDVAAFQKSLFDKADATIDDVAVIEVAEVVTQFRRTQAEWSGAGQHRQLVRLLRVIGPEQNGIGGLIAQRRRRVPQHQEHGRFCLDHPSVGRGAGPAFAVKMFAWLAKWLQRGEIGVRRIRKRHNGREAGREAKRLGRAASVLCVRAGETGPENIVQRLHGGLSCKVKKRSS